MPTLKPQTLLVLSQFLAVAAVDIYSTVYGIVLAFPVLLIPALSEKDNGETFHLNQEQISWIGSITLLFVAIGNAFSGAFTRLIGCKKAMQLMCIPFLAYCLILGFCNDYWQVLFSLSLSGLAGGLLEASIPGYISEISQPHLRASFISSTTFGRSLGSFIIFLLGSLLNWRNVALLCAVPPLISFCLLFFIPESPLWLLIKNKEVDARKSLAWFRGWLKPDDVETEFQEMVHYLKSAVDSSKKDKWKKVFLSKPFLWPLSIVVLVIFIQNCTGLVSFHYYAAEIFEALIVPVSKYHTLIFLSMLESSGFFTGSFLMRYMGKRLLNFVSVALTATCFSIVGTYAYLTDIKYLTIGNTLDKAAVITNGSNYDNWMPLIVLLLAAFVNCCGLQLLAWILIGELYSAETQVFGAALSTVIFNLVAFLVTKVTLQLISSLTLYGSFWFFSALSLAGVVILYFVLPETEGKSLQEISDHFSGISKLDNKVRKKPSQTT